MFFQTGKIYTNSLDVMVMNTMVITRLIIFAVLMSSFAIVAIGFGIYYGNKLNKQHKTVINGFIVDQSEIDSSSSYLDEYIKSSAQMFSKNVRISEREPEVKRLESIPSGMVSKLFINGRGSWRLTQGNIMTKEFLVEAIRSEYRHNI